jgi:ATP-dependent Clp protease protease subunit
MGDVVKFPAQPGYKIVARGSDAAELYLYGVIGGDFFGEGVTAKQVADDLKAFTKVKTIHLRINSEGGSVFEGKAIYSLLTQHPARVVAHIDGLAASAASFIAMAADEINIAEGAFVMIHNAHGVCMGGADDMRSYANLLDAVNETIREVYVARTKQSAKDIAAWMDAETWMAGKEAVANGFADTVVESLKIAAQVSDPSKYKHLPAALMPRRAAAVAQLAALKRK